MLLAELDFTSFGDSQAYEEIARNCARFLEGADGGTCFDELRPIGIAVVYAIPFLIGSDNVSISYMTLAINIAFLVLLVFSALRTFNSLISDDKLALTFWPTSVIRVVLVAFTIICTVAFIPVRLSDLISLSLFFTGISIVVARPIPGERVNYLVAGIVSGSSVLFKQNYAIYIGLFVIWWAVALIPRRRLDELKKLFLFVLGLSVMLVQIFLVYMHTGDFWFFKKSARDGFLDTNKQPFVEFVAYTEPMKSGFLTALDQAVTDSDFIVIKFYKAMTRFDWSAYLGRFDGIDIKISVNQELLFASYLSLGIAMLVLFATFFIQNKWLLVVYGSSLTATLSEAVVRHVENRYFIDFRFTFVLTALVLVTYVVLKFRKDGSDLVLQNREDG